MMETFKILVSHWNGNQATDLFFFHLLVLTELVRMVMSGWGSNTHTLSFEFIPNCFLLYCLCHLTPPSMSSYLQQVCVCFFSDIRILFLKCLFCPMWRNPFISFSKYYPALQRCLAATFLLIISPVASLSVLLSSAFFGWISCEMLHLVVLNKKYVWSVSQFVSQIHLLLKKSSNVIKHKLNNHSMSVKKYY